MSVDEDNELRELVSQTLESNGILAKIRAELRASVFLALEEQDAFKDKPNLINKALKDFVSTSEGAIVICLVREFLEFFGLEFTMAVFDPETQLGNDYEHIGRNRLAKDLNLKTVKKSAPLLVQVVQSVCNGFTNDESEDVNSRTSSPIKEDLEKPLEDKAELKLPVSGNAFTEILKSDNLVNSKSSVTVNGTSKLTESIKDQQNLDVKQRLNEVKSPQNSTVPQPNIRKPDSLKLDISQMNVKSVNSSSLSSLGGLPPLHSLTNGQVQVSKQILGQKDVTNDIKALLDQGLGDSQENNYEEDFHSSISDKTKRGQISGSGSEIEEEISSAGDDQTSISGGGDEATIDTTISQLSGHADYLENI